MREDAETEYNLFLNGIVTIIKKIKYIPRCGCRFCTAYNSWKKTTSLYNEKDTHTLARKQGFKLIGDINI
jgi:hypothetical protein